MKIYNNKLALASFAVVLSIGTKAVAEPRWVPTGEKKDWGQRDTAHTSGSEPKYTVQGRSLCDNSHFNQVAVCWKNNKDGHVKGILSDFTEPKPEAWCTYKNKSINANMEGERGFPGRVYVCKNVTRKKQM